MHDGFSTVDGFVDVNEGIREMIKYVANEPSVGLFFVQQHTHNAVPNLINIKDKIVEKSHEIVLHTEDFDDSISMINSMKECGFSIADEMNKDIKKSLLIMSTSQPKKGSIRNPGFGFQIGRSSSWSPAAFTLGNGHSQTDGGSNSGYFSTVINSAKQTAATLRWPQLDTSQLRNPLGSSYLATTPPPESVLSTSTSVSALPIMEDELPLSSQTDDEQLDSSTTAMKSLSTEDLSHESESFEKFLSDQEAKLKEWLEDTDK